MLWCVCAQTGPAPDVVSPAEPEATPPPHVTEEAKLSPVDVGPPPVMISLSLSHCVCGKLCGNVRAPPRGLSLSP